MKLVNLRLNGEPLASGIEAEGHVWDFHDSLALESTSQNVSKRSVRLSWRPGLYGELPFPVRAVELVFTGVSYFEVTPRDAEIPDFGEDTCLSGVSRVSPEEDTHELLVRGVPLLAPEVDQFHLWFEFRGGQRIRIGAKSVVFQITRERAS